MHKLILLLNICCSSLCICRKACPYNSPYLKVKLGTPDSNQTDSKIEIKESISTSHASSTIEGNVKKAPHSLTALPKKSNERNFTNVLPCDLSIGQDMDVDGVSLPSEDKCREMSGVAQVEILQEKKISDMNGDLIGLNNVSKKVRPL